MNLNTLRHYLLLRGGEIRAWAMTQKSYVHLYDEAPEVITWPVSAWPTSAGVHVLGIPVVFVGPSDPEGVIV